MAGQISLADVVVVVPLSEEFECARTLFSMADAWQIRDAYYYPSASTDYNLRLWFTLLNEMGNGPALSRTNEILRYIKPRLIVCIGIGGSVSDDLLLGDVALCSTVSDIIDASKITDTSHSYELRTVSRSFSVSNALRNYLVNFRFIRQTYFAQWQKQCDDKRGDILKSIPLSSLTDSNSRSLPYLHTCHFASGIVLASNRFNIKAGDRELKVIETEGAGVARACCENEYPAPFLIIRGISDFADTRKTALEAKSNGQWRALAAHNAFSLLDVMLRDVNFLETLPKALEESISHGKTVVLPVIPKFARDDARGILTDIYEEMRGGCILDIFIKRQDDFMKALCSYQFQQNFVAESPVIQVCLLFAQNFVMKEERSGNDLTRSEFVLERLEESILSRLNVFEVTLPLVAMMYYHTKAYVQHRRGLMECVVTKKKAALLAKSSRNVIEFACHYRCVYCFYAETIASSEDEWVEDYIAHLDGIEKLIDLASAKSKKETLRILTALVKSVFVKMKVVFYGGREFLTHYTKMEEFFRQAESYLDMRKDFVRDNIDCVDYEYELDMSVLKVYRGVYAILVNGKDRSMEIQEGAVTAKAKGFRGVCHLRLPKYVTEHFDYYY